MNTLSIIRFYQRKLSKPVSVLTLIGGCRFTPTCSEYMYQAVERYGTIKGLFLGFKRILQCNPFTKAGYDPLK